MQSCAFVIQSHCEDIMHPMVMPIHSEVGPCLPEVECNAVHMLLWGFKVHGKCITILAYIMSMDMHMLRMARNRLTALCQNCVRTVSGDWQDSVTHMSIPA